MNKNAWFVFMVLITPAVNERIASLCLQA